MNSIINYLLIFFLLQSCTGKNNFTKKSIAEVTKVVLKEEAPEEFFYWEMDDHESLWDFDLGDVNALMHYIDSMKLALGEEAFNQAVRKEAIQNVDKSLLEKEEENGDRINALLVHTGSLGKIRKVNYLESQILNYQIEKYPMFSQPTEFHGFIAKNSNNNKLRIYFGSSDTEWPPHPTILIKELEKEQHKDWKLIGHLHNHYCKKDKNYVGILAPSLADDQYYKILKETFNIEKAFITNGINTVEIESKDFEKFESH